MVRTVLEGAAFTLALGLTVASAIAVKEHRAPALVAVDTVHVAQPGVKADVRTERVAPSTRSASGAAKSVPVVGSSDPSIRYYNGRPVRPVRTIEMTVTAYSPDARSCGKWADGITASNKSVWTNGMQLVAADTRLLPFGTLLTVPGYAGDEIVPVLDRGGAIKGKRLDVLYPTHEIALQWGVQKIPVVVWEYAD